MSAPQSPRALTPGKRRLFAAVTLALPFVLLLLGEAALRVANYGGDLSLFTTVRVPGGTFRVMNPGVAGRYFPGTSFHPATSLDAFAESKPPGSFRIFCLGGSTTAGYPYWFNGAFSTYLRDRLHALFPEKRIDVVNLGMTATNSFTVLDIARDLHDAGADLLIVYDGHNEFYGAFGVASRESPAGARWLTDLSLRLLPLRTFRLARDIYLRILSLFAGARAGEERGTMMERLAYGENVPYGSALYREALADFRENLGDLSALCSARGTALILGTQVSNIRTLPPFVSAFRPGTGGHTQEEFAGEMAGGGAALARGAGETACALFRKAEALDSLRADAAFGEARALEAMREISAARAAFIRARDLDQLRFRASSDFNEAIMSMNRGARCSVVDMENVFAADSPDSIVGNELIWEHLHPTARGAFLMARAYAHAMAAMGLIAPAEEWQRRDTLNEMGLWERRPVTPLDDIIAARKNEILTSGWPFRPGTPVVSAVNPADTLAEIAEQVTRSRWSWQRAHEEAIRFYTGKGEWNLVDREYRTVISELPLDVQPMLAYAHFLLARGRFDEMNAVLAGTLAIAPTKLAYRALGDLALARGNSPVAAEYYRKLWEFPQEKSERLENGYLLGLAEAQSGATDSAGARMKALIALEPGYGPAVQLLRKIDEAARGEKR